jgi:hypothetical protein
MSHIRGIMVTMTTYGTWLRGDARGWVDDGRILPANPALEADNRRRMNHPPFVFPRDQWFAVGAFIGRGLIDRQGQRVWALSVQAWHVHFVVGDSDRPIAEIVKCAKDAVRYGLEPGRPIWSDGYDTRFCFDERSLRARIDYVMRHQAPEAPLWDFLTVP